MKDDASNVESMRTYCTIFQTVSNCGHSRFNSEMALC